MEEVQRVKAVAQEHSDWHTALRCEYVICVMVICKQCDLVEEMGAG